MNQPNAPAILTRAVPPAESPDMLYVMRRHKWLLVWGTLLGAGIATGLYFYLAKTQPRYESYVEYQVLPPPRPLGPGSDLSAPQEPSADDISQFIHRQVLYITQPRILDEIIKTKEFQTDVARPDDPNAKSQWLTENWKSPIKQLQKDLTVTPLIESAAFKISMTTRDPYEAFKLVSAVQQVYVQSLRSDNNQVTQDRLQSLTKILSNQETTVKNQSEALNSFREQLNIPALTSRHAIELQALQEINAELMKDESNERVTKGTLERITKQSADPENLVVSPDMEEFIKEDPEMRTLENTKLALDQEKAASTARRATPVEMLSLDARITTVQQQTDDLRKGLIKQAAARELDKAQADEQGFSAQVEFMRQLASDKEDQVKTLDSSLIRYQQRVDDLKTQQDVLDKLRQQYTYQTLASNTDDTRIQAMVSAVAPDPKDFVWPKSIVFIPLGTAAGLGLSFLLSYLLVLTDTRVRTPRDVTKILQMPLLGFVPDESDDRELVGDVTRALMESPHSMMAESFRQIRGQLSAQTENSPVNTLLVASIAPGGGATTVACNLAAGMALNGRRVLLVDANFYRPGLDKVYRDIPAEGFSDALGDPALLASVIVPCANLPKLHVMGAGGQLARASSEMLEGKNFRDLLEQLRTQYDLVIFDGAPLSLVADSLTLGARLDGVISVIRAGEVSRGTVTRVREQLRQVHAHLLGFVLNAAQVSNTGYFKQNYRSFYSYAGESRRAGSRSVSL